MFEKFPSIEQYRHIIKKLTERSQLVGKDENGKAIYDHTKPLPTINFTQTVKIHGTNGGVILFKDGTIRTQSRNRVLSPESDNNGFDKWVAERSDVWTKISRHLFDYDDFKGADKIVVYGEFAGENIQRKVAIADTPKSFYVFDVVAHKDGVEVGSMDFWESDYCLFELDEHNIYSIFQFPHQWVSIDLNCAVEYIPQLQEIALAIEAECPVGKFHGVSGIGEGAVFTAHYDGNVYRFKVKGEQHKVSKIKDTVKLSDIEIKSIKQFVKDVMTENRLNQGLEYLSEMNIEHKMENVGHFIKWCVNDVIKEEWDIIIARQLDEKAVKKDLSAEARKFFMNIYN